MEILSREIIKPSSPTPNHLKEVKLSYLDLLHRPTYIPLILFFQADESTGLTISNHSQISHRLKQSLSNTLTAFYPLAGTVKNGSPHVDCDDVGAEFIEARVDVRLADVIQDPKPEDLKQYSFQDPAGGKPATTLIVKLTFFKCGGISIAIGMSHVLADGGATIAFVSAWAAACRGQPNFPRYSFDAANYFPPRDAAVHDQNANFLPLSDERFVAKRFIFNEESIRVLQREATSQLVTNPSRVEAVSAFIWMHFIEMVKSKPNSEDAAGSGIFPALQATSLRGRSNPPLSLENVFGNCYMLAFALYDANSSAVSNRYPELVSTLRSSITKIDGDYIRKAQHGDNYLNDLNKLSSMHAKGVLREGCVISSMCGFPMYGLAFGWGNPIWVFTPAMAARNTTIMMRTRCGKGIEAWVNMERDEVEILDAKIRRITTNAQTAVMARL